MHYDLGLAYENQSDNKQAIMHYKAFVRLARTYKLYEDCTPDLERRIQELK